MVVIAIVGILFGIALSSYQSNVLKTRRYAAQSCLMEYSQYMERHYTTNTSNPMQYTGASLPSAELGVQVIAGESEQAGCGRQAARELLTMAGGAGRHPQLHVAL
jgi:Tfp pilus assembly protein PilE